MQPIVILLLFSLLTAAVTTVSNADCINKPDGAYSIGCQSNFLCCIDGIASIETCLGNSYFDEKSQNCPNHIKVPFCQAQTTSLPAPCQGSTTTAAPVSGYLTPPTISSTTADPIITFYSSGNIDSAKIRNMERYTEWNYGGPAPPKPWRWMAGDEKSFIAYFICRACLHLNYGYQKMQCKEVCTPFIVIDHISASFIVINESGKSSGESREGSIEGSGESGEGSVEGSGEVSDGLYDHESHSEEIIVGPY